MASEFHVKTRGEVQVIDVTDEVRARVGDTGVEEGVACVFVVGSTAAITTLEFEPGLAEEDLPGALARLFPPHGEASVLPARESDGRLVPSVQSVDYGHQRMWQDGNGHSHVRAAFLGPSLTVPVVNGNLPLGTWQQIVLVELDNKPRDRRVIVQVTGA
jgi:thiamine phosphate synthase YjbQ (UPF0047 family)